jgi:hypothetical protein
MNYGGGRASVPSATYPDARTAAGVSARNLTFESLVSRKDAEFRQNAKMESRLFFKARVLRFN